MTRLEILFIRSQTRSVWGQGSEHPSSDFLLQFAPLHIRFCKDMHNKAWTKAQHKKPWSLNEARGQHWGCRHRAPRSFLRWLSLRNPEATHVKVLLHLIIGLEL